MVPFLLALYAASFEARFLARARFCRFLRPMAKSSKKAVDPSGFASDVGFLLMPLIEEREELFSKLLTSALGHPPESWAICRSLYSTARFALEMAAEGLELPVPYYLAFMNGSADAFDEIIGEPDVSDDVSGRVFWRKLKIPVMLDWNRVGLEPFTKHVGLEMRSNAAGLDALLIIHDSWVAKNSPVPGARPSISPAPILTRYFLKHIFGDPPVTDENLANLTSAYDTLYLDCWHQTQSALKQVLFSKPDDPFRIERNLNDL